MKNKSCVTDTYSSRTCELGTRCCTVEHNNVYRLKDYKKDKKPFDVIKFAQEKLIEDNPNNTKYI